MANSPFGFQLAADGESLVADENEQRIIELIRSLRDVDGMSYRAIAAELDARSIPSKESQNASKVKSQRHAVSSGDS